MEKESMLQMIRRMEEIGRLQKALSTRNTYIDRMVANARRDFTDEESRQYEENEKRIEECPGDPDFFIYLLHSCMLYALL